MKKLFGTDGMRGEAGQFPLDAATIEIVGASLASHLKQTLGRAPLIVIGRDTRESGQWLEDALVAGASRAGAKLRSAGVITTPGVAYLARALPADAGVVISASHNEYRDNGIKIFAPSGRKLDDTTESLIERDVFANRIESTPDVEGSSGETFRASHVDTTKLRGRYLDFLAKRIGRGLSLNELRIVVDCANGASYQVAPELFRQLGARVVAINNEPNGRNINLSSGSLHTEALQTEVIKQNADLGVAFDGDADRALFVDAAGQLVNGDACLWILANYRRSHDQLNHDMVVATVMSNIGLELAFERQGIRLIRTDVGDKYVLEELLRRDASLGGEQSGHIIFPDLSLAGDGLITTLCILKAMSHPGKSLNELTRGFQMFPQILVNIPVKDKPPFSEIPLIKNTAHEVEAALGSRGRLLLRYSGTEPLARVMIEGESQHEIEKHAEQLVDVIKKELGAEAQ